jgi:putative SOS response-associated peptidase YedK
VCGRFALATSASDELRQRFPLGESVEIRQRFNVAPGDDVVTVGVRDGVATGRLLRWGLVPPWARDPSVGFKMINARAETVAEKPAYRDSFAKRRCLIVADGFYEWQRSGRAKLPFHITREDTAPFAFAGLWTGWKDPETEEWLRTCSIVTTDANDKLRGIHPRMPVILEQRDEQDWLDPDTPVEHLQRLMAPLPAAETHARAVSRAVNDARYDGPHCLDDAEPMDLKAFAEAVNAAAAGGGRRAAKADTPPPGQDGLF